MKEEIETICEEIRTCLEGVRVSPDFMGYGNQKFDCDVVVETLENLAQKIEKRNNL